MKWSDILPQEALELSDTLLSHAQQERNEGKRICPKQEDVLRALRLTPPDKVKVCIVGQDPYHTPGVANGLAFSIYPDNLTPPSLRNIFRELVDDVEVYPENGDLTRWAEHGVLLINACLTVYEHQANSHFRWGWQKFTSAVLEAAPKLPQPIVFMLWGANVINLKDHIHVSPGILEDNVLKQNIIKKDIIMSSHPSPFSAFKPCGGYPPFIGSRPFSKANLLLKERGAELVDWSLS